MIAVPLWRDLHGPGRGFAVQDGKLFDTSADVIRSDNKLPGSMIIRDRNSMYVPAHTVKSGDTLSGIAGWYGVSLAQLKGKQQVG